MDIWALNAISQAPLAIGTAGAWNQAKKRRIAPVLGCLSEITWLVWAVLASYWLVIPWCLLWAGLYVRTYIYWRNDD